MEDFISPVPVVTVTGPGKLPVIFVAANDLDQTLEPAEHGRGLCVQIEHDLIMGHFGILA
jgi:hypothetical protein